ncbi:MAG TPA: rhombotarget lipoprotein [Holophagaceae bacterium]|nr:rhombotarget lipoprotein [Holophagaceae bacterium]
MSRRTLAFPLALLLLSAGCIHPETHIRRSSLMAYLYPKAQAAPQPHPEGARLQVPLKLGVAFVPGGGGWREDHPVPGLQERPLVEMLRTAFKDKPWVGEIKAIPTAYLRADGGFDNLDQVCRMFGVDVVALVSVDQIQHTDPKWYSFAYLSIVGAFVLPAEKNSTSTLIDAAVFHVPTRTFLMRAPGQSTIKGSTTAIAQEELLRRDAGESLRLAMADLAKNLDAEVGAFKAEVAEGRRTDVDMVDKQGQSLRQTGGKGWGGAFGWMEVGVAALALAALRRRRP